MKKRADILIYEKGLVQSRNIASALIKQGLVKINKKIVSKNSELFEDTSEIKLLNKEIPYVGRGGLKLEKALVEFQIDPNNLTILDVGSSTGGFTECLLRQGAKKIYAVDVGTNQLADKLKRNKRVVSMEKTDIRDVDIFPENIDLIVIDVSFISLEQILPSIIKLSNKQTKIIALVKPQFETSRDLKNKQGVVKNEEDQQNALKKIKTFCQKNNLEISKEIDSPILGGSGNKEYFLLLQLNI